MPISFHKAIALPYLTGECIDHLREGRESSGFLVRRGSEREKETASGA